jgi:hypothetical protein
MWLLYLRQGEEKTALVAMGQRHPEHLLPCLSIPHPIPHAKQRWPYMDKLHVLVADGKEVMHVPQNVKLFRLNPFDWWAGYDLTSVKLAYLRETGLAKEEAFDEEEELPQEAMKTARIYPNLYAKESRTFQEELALMVDQGQEFPCYFASR